jgi:hypothetical protein
VLEDCISINFNDDFGAYLRDGVQSQLNTKRLYKLVHIVLYGYENSLLLRDEKRGEAASSPPGKLAKRSGVVGGGHLGGSKKTGKEYAHMVEQCHMMKVCIVLPLNFFSYSWSMCCVVCRSLPVMMFCYV